MACGENGFIVNGFGIPAGKSCECPLLSLAATLTLPGGGRASRAGVFTGKPRGADSHQETGLAHRVSLAGKLLDDLHQAVFLDGL
jgi:hypothetical protein